MNRRGFVGAALACVGFLFPQKAKATTSDEFKFGDYVDLDAPEYYRPSKMKGYITFIDEKSMVVQTLWTSLQLYFASGQWYINGHDLCKVSRSGERCQ